MKMSLTLIDVEFRQQLGGAGFEVCETWLPVLGGGGGECNPGVHVAGAGVVHRVAVGDEQVHRLFVGMEEDIHLLRSLPAILQSFYL